jgi:hypothetical protein
VLALRSSWMVGALASGLAACGNVVDGSAPATTTTSTTATGSGGAAAPSPNANAIVLPSLPPNGICWADPPSHPPHPVFLYVASRPITCASPVLPDFLDPTCGSAPITWEVCIPLDLGTAPAVIDLATYPYLGEVFTVCDGCTAYQCGVCTCKDEAEFVWGTLDVGAVAAGSVTVDLIGTNDDWSSADGHYTALRCP